MRTRQAQTRSPPESCSQTVLGTMRGELQAGVRGEGKLDPPSGLAGLEGAQGPCAEPAGPPSPFHHLCTKAPTEWPPGGGPQDCAKELKHPSQFLETHLPPHLSCPLAPDRHAMASTERSAQFPKCLLGLIVSSPHTTILSGPPLPMHPVPLRLNATSSKKPSSCRRGRIWFSFLEAPECLSVHPCLFSISSIVF